MRLDEGRCAALVVEIAGEAPRFTCAIYDVRPDACRSLERGSGACRGERHEKGDRPLLAAARLVRQRGPSG
jgi:hypothetical protein